MRPVIQEQINFFFFIVLLYYYCMDCTVQRKKKRKKKRPKYVTKKSHWPIFDLCSSRCALQVHFGVRRSGLWMARPSCWVQWASRGAAGGTALPLDRPEGAAPQQLQLVTEERGHGVPPASHTWRDGAQFMQRRNARRSIVVYYKAECLLTLCVSLVQSVLHNKMTRNTVLLFS